MCVTTCLAITESLDNNGKCMEALTTEYLNTSEKKNKIDIGQQLCLSLLDSGQFSEVRKYGNEMLALLEESPDKIVEMQINLWMGVSCHNQGEIGKAKEYYERHLQIAEEIYDDEDILYGYLNLAYVERTTSSIQKAMDYYFKAVEICQKISDEEKLISVYKHIAVAYTSTKNYTFALDYFKRAIKLDKSRFQTDEIAYYMSELYFDIKDYALALGYQRRALECFVKKENTHYVISSLYMMAQIYLVKNDYNKALEHAIQAHNYFNNYENILLFANLCILTGKIFTYKEDYFNAQQYFHKFTEIENSIEFDEVFFYYYECFFMYNASIGNYQEAFNYQTKYLNLKNKMFEEEMSKNLSLATANFEYEQKKKEAEMYKEKNSIIERQNIELQQLHNEKVNLMNTISHDLKNYIGATMQALEMACLKDSNLKINKYISISEKSNIRALNLVKEILYSSKLEASPNALNLHLCNLNELIKENEDTLVMRGNNKNINIFFEYAASSLMVMIDKDKWNRIFENLTTNAIKFTHVNGNIKITTKRIENQACVIIKDTGIGIEKENISKLFLSFSGIGRKGTQGEESTGLGLSIVKKLIELHGGTIDVTSEIGAGTEFTLKFNIKEN